MGFLKTACKWIGSLAVDRTVSTAIKNTTQTYYSGVIDKAVYSIGGEIIAGMVAEKAFDYIDHTLDEVAVFIVDMEKMIKKGN